MIVTQTRHYSRSVLPDQQSGEHSQWLRKKSQNKYIKIFKYREEFHTFLEISPFFSFLLLLLLLLLLPRQVATVD